MVIYYSLWLVVIEMRNIVRESDQDSEIMKSLHGAVAYIFAFYLQQHK